MATSSRPSSGPSGVNADDRHGGEADAGVGTKGPAAATGSNKCWAEGVRQAELTSPRGTSGELGWRRRGHSGLEWKMPAAKW